MLSGSVLRNNSLSVMTIIGFFILDLSLVNVPDQFVVASQFDFVSGAVIRFRFEATDYP
jgi:hypothetical protein